MSVLIKDVEMPNNCGECPCFYYEYNECNAIGGRMVDRRGTPPSDCPLVPVPPHGDLIDRDAILKAYGLSTSKVDCSGCKYKNEVRCEKYELCEALNDAPTIIEAEEGE